MSISVLVGSENGKVMAGSRRMLLLRSLMMLMVEEMDGDGDDGAWLARFGGGGDDGTGGIDPWEGG